MSNAPPDVPTRIVRPAGAASSAGAVDPSADAGVNAPQGSDFPIVAGYEIVGEIGRGGMAVIYKARQRAIGRWVALKMLAGQGPDEIARFRVEVEAAGALQHPNIVQIHETCVDDEGRRYFSLELVEGGSMDQRFHGVPQPPREAARLMETVARAVQHAHDNGIVHRDLKPSNVLLTPEGMPKVSDFGIARRLEKDSDLTSTGMILGSPSYMAPEQARGDVRGVGPPADVYGLGGILYFLLIGRPPFRGGTMTETLRHVIETPPVSPRRLQPNTPRDLETICLKCLEKEPAKRYASASLLAADLLAFLCDQTISARPVAAPEALARWCRRNPRVAFLTFAVLASLFTIAAGSTVFAFRLKREQRAADEARRSADKSAERAEAEREVAVDALMQLVQQINRTLVHRADTQALRRSLLEQVLAKLKTIGRDGAAGVLAARAESTAELYMGNLYDEMGLRTDARVWCERAHDLATTLARENPNAEWAWWNLAMSSTTLAGIDPDWKRARELARQAETAMSTLAALPRSADLAPGEVEYGRAQIDNQLAGFAVKAGELDAARGFIESALRVSLDMMKLPESGAEWHLSMNGTLGDAAKDQVSTTYERLGDFFIEQKSDPEDALPAYRQGLEVASAWYEGAKDNTVAEYSLANLQYRVGVTLGTLGHADEARKVMSDAANEFARLHRLNPKEELAGLSLMLAMARSGQHEGAAAMAATILKAGANGGEHSSDVWAAAAYGHCAASVRRDRAEAALPPGDRALYEGYLTAALAVLRDLVARGAIDVVTLKTEGELAPIRAAAPGPFADLLRDLDAAPRP